MRAVTGKQAKGESDMYMSRKLVNAVIEIKGWQPYIKSHWMELGSKSKAGVIVTFKDHEQHEYKCSYNTAKEILLNNKGEWK